MATKGFLKGEQIQLISHIERVAGKARNSKLSPSVLRNVDHDLEKISAFLDCSSMQSFLFSAILALNFEKDTVSIHDIAEFINCSPLLMAHYLSDIETLESKRLIRRDSEGKHRKAMMSAISFYITREVLDSVYREDKTLIKQKSQTSMTDMLITANEIIEDRFQGRLSYAEMLDDFSALMDACKDLDFTRQLKALTLPEHELAMMLHVCFETLNGDPEIDLGLACDKLYGDISISFMFRRELARGSSTIRQKGLIKLEDGYFRSDRLIILTEKGLATLFGEDMEILVKKKEKLVNMIRPEKITLKDLFFNEHESKELDVLNSMLSDTGYRKVCERLRKSNLRTGFTVLLYGMPGTGKTESVYQLARTTGRSILRVNISECKDKWYGESEKITRHIFDNYREMLGRSPADPILLFNEADGILARRRELRSSAVDQTENAIQNILLQEMEEFEGILIATTNLTINLDKAFERRFLYKIRFENPKPEIRAKIWLDKLPVLTGTEAMDLARRFDLTGGQIDNIVRKYATEEVIHGRAPDMERIREFCAIEKLERDLVRNIRFIK